MAKFDRVAAAAVLMLCAASNLHAENYPVRSVTKADQVVVEYAGLPVTVHLANLEFPAGYDAPAMAEVSKLLQGQQVKVTYVPEEGMDLNGLPFCYVSTSGGLNINQMIVKKGWARYTPGSNPPKSFHQLMQLSQSAAQQDKVGLWADFVDKNADVAQAKPIPAKVVPVKALDVAPADYNGLVIADLTAKEYLLPGSRFAQSIRPGAKIEYKSPEEAERAGKLPSPFCFPDRAKEFAAKHVASASAAGSAPATPEKIVADSRKCLEDAIKLIQTARELSRNDNKGATANFKKAGKILSDALDRLTPVADANPNDQSIQSLAEEMSMNLYSCNKYQTL